MKRLWFICFIYLILASLITEKGFGAPCYGTSLPPKGRWDKGLETNIVLERELKAPYGEIQSNQYFLNLSYGFRDWFSLDGKLGMGDFVHRPDNSDKIDYDTNFAGGYGFRIRFFKKKEARLKGVLGFQHISIHPGAENVNNNKNEAILDDWQISGLVSKDFSFLTAYIGSKFSRCYLIHKVNEGERKRRRSDEPFFGLVLGIDLPIEKDWRINLEGRFIDETAFSVGLTDVF